MEAMADYNKLKVTELKEELKKRGISITGLKLKQQFIDKLLEVDASEPNDQIKPAVEVEDAPNGLPRHNGETKQSTQEESRTVKSQDIEAKLIPEKNTLVEKSSSERIPTIQTKRGRLSSESHSPTASQQRREGSKSPTARSLSPENTIKANEVAVPLAASQTPPRADVFPPSGIATPGALQTEIRDDSRKRKIRSLTPPPTTDDVAKKKARVSGDDPSVGEKTRMVEATSGDLSEASPTHKSLNAAQEPSEMTVHRPSKMIAGSASPKEEFQNEPDQGDSECRGADGLKDNGLAKSTGNRKIETPSKKNRGANTRFKGLVRTDSHRGESPSHEHGVEQDRVVTPALHPATSSLYIRNLKRPLQLPALKTHLISLATPSQSSPQAELIQQFYLDPIKTHALVSFASVPAASRVRSALHDTRWPEEKSREALWVDFIPNEKVEEWIEKEKISGGPTTRWEVIYDDDGNSVHTILQEVGTYRMPPSQLPKTARHPSHGDGMHTDRTTLIHPDRAAFVSRNEARHPTRRPTEDAPPTSDNGFKALDDLFPSTRAKPKLYFKPVSERIAASRRERFRALLQIPEMRGRGADQEMRRYSFEDGDYWVGKGPEFGYGNRGGYRGRGRGNSYLGRLEDSWRGRGR